MQVKELLAKISDNWRAYYMSIKMEKQTSPIFIKGRWIYAKL